MNIGGYTATGPRDANEDSLYFLDFSDTDAFVNGVCAFAMVSDGMGGYQGGDVASKLAVGCAKRYLEQLMEMAQGNRVDLDATAALAEIVQNAHESIRAESNARGNLSMGATFVGAFVSRTHAWIGHVGDSRAYLVRDGQCQQLTEDHSQVGRMLSRGIISESEAQNHPDRNRIERALGFNDARPDVTEIGLVPGDALLLCSDGVYTVLDAETLGSCVCNARDAAAAAERAVKLALRRRTDDNSTAVVVMVGSSAKKARTTVRATAPGTLVEAPQDTLTDLPPTVSRNYVQPRTIQHRTRPDTALWKRVLPFVLLVLLTGAAVYLGMRGCANETQSAGEVALDAPAQNGDGGQQDAPTTPTAPTATDAPADAPTKAPESTATIQTQVNEPSEKPTTEDAQVSTGVASGYDSYTIPAGSYVTLKYIDKNGTAQLFSYEPLELAADPQLLPGVTVVAQTTIGSYGRIEKTYQMLSDDYMNDLKRDVSRYAEGSAVFDSALSQLIEPTAYLGFVQALAQAGTETLDATVDHLAIESLIVTGQ